MKKIFHYAFAIVLSLALISCNKQSGDDISLTRPGLERFISEMYGFIPMDAFNTKDQHTMLATYSKGNDYSVNVTGFWDYAKINSINRFIAKLDEAVEKNVISAETRDQMLGEAIFVRAYCYFAMVRRYGGVPIVTEPLKGKSNPNVPRGTEKETWDFVISELDTAAGLLPDRRSDGSFRATRWAALGLQSRVALYAATLSKYWAKAGFPSSYKSVSEKLTYMESSYTDGYFGKCIEASGKIMTSGKFSLYGGATTSVSRAKENLTELFLQRHDEEFIFGKAYDTGTVVGADNGFDLTNSPNQKHGIGNGAGWGNYSVTSDLVDLFDDYNTAGGRASGTIKTRNDGKEDIYFEQVSDASSTFDETADFIRYYGPMTPFLNKDARFQAWVLYPGTDFRGVSIVAQGGWWLPDENIEFYQANSTTVDDVLYYELGAGTRDGMSAFLDIGSKGALNHSYFWSTAFGIRKFLEPEYTPDKSSNPWYDIRFAEILLNYAEAYAESGKGSRDMAKQALNDIRHRAAFTDSVEPTLENVLHERRVEFAFEGHESYTLWRHRAYLSTGGPHRKHTVVPVLDLRSGSPRYIFPRVNAYWSDVRNSPDGVMIDPLDYYGPIPNASGSRLTVNPCQE